MSDVILKQLAYFEFRIGYSEYINDSLLGKKNSVIMFFENSDFI